MHMLIGVAELQERKDLQGHRCLSMHFSIDVYVGEVVLHCKIEDARAKRNVQTKVTGCILQFVDLRQTSLRLVLVCKLVCIIALQSCVLK